MKASVVINTYNRADYLPGAVRSLAAQSYSEVELVIVNGPSTDRTAAVLEDLRAEGFAFKLLDCPSRNLSESRNIGIAAAAGDVVLFLDDDAIAHARWVERLMRPYQDETVGAAGGFTLDHTGMGFQCRFTVCDRLGNATFLNTLDPAHLVEAGTGHAYPSLLGTNCSFRRSLLLKLGGFDEVFAYLLDETDVCLRVVEARQRIVTVPDALVLHKYAPSHTRTAERIPSSLLAPARSKAYFMLKHAAPSSSITETYARIDQYRRDIDFSNRWFLDHKKISVTHFDRLNRELKAGIAEGIALGNDPATKRRNSAHLAQVHPLSEEFVPIRTDGRFHFRPGSLRIYFVAQGYPPADTAGIARWTHECALGLQALGHEVHVITRSAGDVSHVDVVDGVWVHQVADRLDEERLFHSPVPLPAGILRRAEAVLAEVQRSQSIWGVDVVSAPIWDLEGILCQAYLDVPVVTSLHTTYQLALPFKPYWQHNREYRRKHVNRVIEGERWLLDHSKAILANSQEIVREIDAAYQVHLSQQAIPLVVVPHGLGELPAAPIEAAPGSPLKLLFVGRLEERKGPDTLLQALALLHPRTPELHVQFIGQAPSDQDAFARELQDAADRARECLPQLTLQFSGYVQDAELAQAYAQCDLFVAPSRFESFGLILIEAMRWGRPVVSCDIGGMREVVEQGRSGLLVPPGDAPALAKALEQLIGDPALRARIGESGRQRYSERFTRQQMARALQTFFAGRVNRGARV